MSDRVETFFLQGRLLLDLYRFARGVNGFISFLKVLMLLMHAGQLHAYVIIIHVSVTHTLGQDDVHVHF